MYLYKSSGVLFTITHLFFSPPVQRAADESYRRAEEARRHCEGARSQ